MRQICISGTALLILLFSVKTTIYSNQINNDPKSASFNSLSKSPALGYIRHTDLQGQRFVSSDHGISWSKEEATDKSAKAKLKHTSIDAKDVYYSNDNGLSWYRSSDEECILIQPSFSIIATSVSNSIKILSNIERQVKIEVSVFDLFGSTILTNQTIEIGGDTGPAELATGRLLSGVYLCKIIYQSKPEYLKFSVL